jgi:hypothetical protein
VGGVWIFSGTTQLITRTTWNYSLFSFLNYFIFCFVCKIFLTHQFTKLIRKGRWWDMDFELNKTANRNIFLEGSPLPSKIWKSIYVTSIIGYYSDAKSPGFTGSLPVCNLVSRWTNKISRYSRRTDRALRHKFRESKKI